MSVFQTSPPSKNTSPSPDAICLAFIDDTTGWQVSFSTVPPREPRYKMHPFCVIASVMLSFTLQIYAFSVNSARFFV